MAPALAPLPDSYREQGRSILQSGSQLALRAYRALLSTAGVDRSRANVAIELAANYLATLASPNRLRKGLREPDRWVAIPASLGRALRRALRKAKGHKYIRRVRRNGRWVYFYNAAGGKGLGHADELHVGAKFAAPLDGAEGHYEVLAVEGDKLRVRHDETGHEVTIARDAFQAMLRRVHARVLAEHTMRTHAELTAVAEHGTDSQKRRMRAYASRYEHTATLLDEPDIRALLWPKQPAPTLVPSEPGRPVVSYADMDKPWETDAHVLSEHGIGTFAEVAAAGAEKIGQLIGDAERGKRIHGDATMRLGSKKARAMRLGDHPSTHPDWVPDMSKVDWLVLNSSGGKDSIAMLARAIEVADRQGFPRDRMVVVHADLGRVEWGGTKELAAQQAAMFGVRFEVVKRDGQDLLQHIENRYYQLACRIEDTGALSPTSAHAAGQVARVADLPLAEVSTVDLVPMGGMGARLVEAAAGRMPPGTRLRTANDHELVFEDGSGRRTTLTRVRNTPRWSAEVTLARHVQTTTWGPTSIRGAENRRRQNKRREVTTERRTVAFLQTALQGKRLGSLTDMLAAAVASARGNVEPTPLRRTVTPVLTAASRAELLEEKERLRGEAAVPDKVFMPAGWNPVAHREKHAAAHRRIDEIREALGQHVWQRMPDAAHRATGMPRAKHREAVKRAAESGRNVPTDVLDAHGLSEPLTWGDLFARLPEPKKNSRKAEVARFKAEWAAAVAKIAAALPERSVTYPPGFEDNPKLRRTVSREVRAEYILASARRKKADGYDPADLADWGLPNPWPGDKRYCTSEHKRAVIAPLVTKAAEKLHGLPAWRAARDAHRKRRKAIVNERVKAEAKAKGLKGASRAKAKKRIEAELAARMPDPPAPSAPRIVNVMGLRAQESEERANKPAFYENDATSSVKQVDDWLPVQGWSEEQVWDRIAEEGMPSHDAYLLDPKTGRPTGKGMRRLSCVFCVYADSHDLVVAAVRNPELFAKYLELEERTGFTFQQSNFPKGSPLGLAGKPKSLRAVADAIREHGATESIVREIAGALRELREAREADLGLVQIGAPRTAPHALAKAEGVGDVHTLGSALLHNLRQLRANGLTPESVQYDFRESGAVVMIDCADGGAYFVGALDYPDAYGGSAAAAAGARFAGIGYEEHGSPDRQPGGSQGLAKGTRADRARRRAAR